MYELNQNNVTNRPSGANNFIPIVGIGASAGGYEAIEQFIRALPQDTGAAYFIIQHLESKRKSLMCSLLSQYSNIKVSEVKNGDILQANRIYVGVPDKLVSIENNTIKLKEQTNITKDNYPINFFFHSLSKYPHKKIICVILSGTGTDGTLGLINVKKIGGMIIAQKENQAKNSGMPKSAIETGLVDLIMSAEDMPREIIKYINNKLFSLPSEEQYLYEKLDNFQAGISKVVALLKSKNGHDFTYYKQSTVYRRIQNRMVVTQTSDISSYIHILESSDNERKALIKNLLIGVTSFFRDKEAFQCIKKTIQNNISLNQAKNSTFRVWVPGCSTGEEAYSIGIILIEIMEAIRAHIEIQIFATDSNNQAIELARTGSYHEHITTDISKKRLSDFFIKQTTSYKIKKICRERIIFATHNLISDPPFSNMDLIVCRNVLIYLELEAQKKIISSFHYILKSEGLLFLGPSESICSYDQLFSTLNSKWKIFKRNSTENLNNFENLKIKHNYFFNKITTREANSINKTIPLHTPEAILLKNFSPPAIIVNNKLDVLHLLGGKSNQYLFYDTDETKFNLLTKSIESLQHPLIKILQKAIDLKLKFHHEIVQLKSKGCIQEINLYIYALDNLNSNEDLFLVVLDDKFSNLKSDLNNKIPFKQKNKLNIKNHYEKEIMSLIHKLEVTRKGFERTNEELKSSNEELQSLNEEAQSSNEELETSKQELQSRNEELMTMNAKLNHKIKEFHGIYNDINNIIKYSTEGILFLDTKMCIRRFTPQVLKFFNFIDGDLGRPLKDITSNILEKNIVSISEQVLETLQNKKLEIKLKNGNIFLMQVFPYRTMDNIIEGVVINFSDIKK